MVNKIIMVSKGYSFMDAEQANVMKANCTCVLIKGENKNIIVDTMTPWDKNFIIEALKHNNILPDDIDLVVSTHGHSDHCGNNNLFLKAKHILGHNVSFETNYFLHDFEKEPFQVDENITVEATPGHTLTCVSVIVKNAFISETQTNPSVVAITGDLFENANDIIDENIWLEASSENPFKQRKNRLKIANLADFIIPGHGDIFKVNNEMRIKLKKDFDNESL